MNNINEIMRELAEYTALKEEMELQIESLKDEIKSFMAEKGVDEVLSDSGARCTWREIISNRFDSTAFKKDFLDVYREYTKATVCKRFTFSA